MEFTEADWSALKAEYCKGFTEAQAEVCRTFCRLRGLIPGKHVIFNLRQSKEWDDTIGAKVPVTKIIFMTTIDAARLIAQRSNEYNGQAPEQYIYLDETGNPSIVSEIPLPHPENRQLPREPWAVRTTIYRKSFDHPITSVARFDAYASTYKTTNGLVLTEMWARRSPEMLAKCSEMLSLRKGFPEELSNLYLTDEIRTESDEAAAPPAVIPASVVPVPPSAPKVNQQPAEATETPRPGEAKVEYHVTEVPATLPAHSGDTLKVVPTKEQIETMDKLLQNPAIQQKLAEEGKKINQEAIDQLKKDVGLKPASELPAPKKKGGRPKKEESPSNGQPVDGGITDADLETLGKPSPEPIDIVANRQAAEAFVESLDPTPTKEEQTGFTARVRALAAAGAQNQDLKNYILNVGKKDDPKQLTVANWNKALEELETILAESKDKLKEVTKNAPLPTF